MTVDGTPNEQEVASAFADLLDAHVRDESTSAANFASEYPEFADLLSPALEAVSAIDTALGVAVVRVRTPERLSGLRITGEIGSGGMGRVLMGEDDRLGRKVAVKVLHPELAGDAQFRQRFLSEARAMAAISHPNVVRIYSLGPVDEPPHFVMELVDGVPLTESARNLDIRSKVELFRKVVGAVAFLHDRAIIHRDLKPGNVLVDREFEPKLLDFGLALQSAQAATRLTLAGHFLGTPDYASPEQASNSDVDRRSDVFSLGVMLYELLTGQLPFSGETAAEQMRAIREHDPVLPRRLEPQIPGDLQNVCLKALEKNPTNRYASARELAADLERFLAGEPVLAVPAFYARMIGSGVEQHLRDIEGWKADRIVTEAEYDTLRHGYDRLVEREDSWILEARRLSLQQVSLYLGAWLLAVGAALIMLYHYPSLRGSGPALLAALAAGPGAAVGLRLWRSGQHRLAIAFLLAFCILLPVTLVTGMVEYGLVSGAQRGRPDLELFSKLASFRPIRNAQIWWALLASLPVYMWLRRTTGAAVFSLVAATGAVLFCVASLLRLGLMEWIDNDPGRPYLYLLPCAFLFLAAGLTLERRGLLEDSRYVYPHFVALTYISLTGVVTMHEPYRHWLESYAPWTRGQIEYLFLLNGAIYFVFQWVFERPSSPQLRTVARVFRFVIPGHLMVPLLLLGVAASDRWSQDLADSHRRFEARLFEVLLPAVAAVFVFTSVPKQMKNYFASGLLFLAIGAVRLQQDLFKDRAAWPTLLIVIGLVFMLVAAKYSPIKVRILRSFRQRSRKFSS